MYKGNCDKDDICYGMQSCTRWRDSLPSEILREVGRWFGLVKRKDDPDWI